MIAVPTGSFPTLMVGAGGIGGEIDRGDCAITLVGDVGGRAARSRCGWAFSESEHDRDDHGSHQRYACSSDDTHPPRRPRAARMPRPRCCLDARHRSQLRRRRSCHRRVVSGGCGRAAAAAISVPGRTTAFSAAATPARAASGTG